MTPTAVPPSCPLPLHFRLDGRKARAVAMSDDLIALVGPDGVAAGLRLVRDPDAPDRASIVYCVQGKDDFELLEGPLGPVWASFEATAARFRARAGASERNLVRACWALSVLLSLLVGIWLAWSPSRPLPRAHESSEQASTWPL